MAPIQQILNKAIIVCSIIAVIALSIVVISLIVIFKKRSDANNVLRNGKRSDDFIYNLLCTTFSRSNLIRNAFVPSNPIANPQTAKYLPIDVICVNRGGVAVMTLRNHRGKIENPIKGDWTIVNPNAEPTTIPNPFEQNIVNTRAIEQILHHEHLNNIPVANMVVYTESSSTKFRYRYEALVFPKELIGRIKDMNKNRFLTRSEVAKVVNAIRRYSKQCPPNLRYPYIIKRAPQKAPSYQQQPQMQQMQRQPQQQVQPQQNRQYAQNQYRR